VPKTYPIPLPPLSNAQPQWELGMRYWYSEGNSTLTSEDLDANALEFVFAVRNETHTVFKGFVGGGWLNSKASDVSLMDVSTDLDGSGWSTAPWTWARTSRSSTARQTSC